MYALDGINSIYNVRLTTTNKAIQLICVRQKPIQFIQDNFDFNFCTVWFDGKEVNHTNQYDLVCPYDGHIMQTYLTACSHIMIDSKAKNAMYRIASTLERIIKYKKRGFIVNNTCELIAIIKNMKKAINAKYRNCII